MNWLGCPLMAVRNGSADRKGSQWVLGCGMEVAFRGLSSVTGTVMPATLVLAMAFGSGFSERGDSISGASAEMGWSDRMS